MSRSPPRGPVHADPTATVDPGTLPPSVFELFFGDVDLGQSSEDFPSIVAKFIEHVAGLLAPQCTNPLAQFPDESILSLVKTLTCLEWRPDYRCAFELTAGDAATLRGASLRVVAPAEVSQLHRGPTGTERQSPFDFSTDGMENTYTLSDSTDTEEKLHLSHMALVLELDSAIANHEADWKKSMKAMQHAVYSPATVAAAAVSMMRRRDLRQPLSKDDIVQPADVGLVMISSGVTVNATPRSFRWQLFSVVVRNHLVGRDREAAVLLATFLVSMLQDDLAMLHAQQRAKQDLAGLRRRLARRQQGLEHAASWLTSDIATGSVYVHLGNCAKVLEDTKKSLQRLDARNAASLQHDTHGVLKALADCAKVTEFHPYTPPKVSPAAAVQHHQMFSIAAAPQSLATFVDAAWLKGQSDSMLLCTHIEHLAFRDMMVLAREGARHPLVSPEVVFQWWDLYDLHTKQLQGSNSSEWVVNLRSRPVLVAMIFWVLIERSMAAEDGVRATAEKITTIPTKTLLQYLDNFVVDACSGVHDVAHSLAAYLRQTKEPLHYAWSDNGAQLGSLLAAEPCMSEVVRNYESERVRLLERAQAIVNDAQTLRDVHNLLKSTPCTCNYYVSIKCDRCQKINHNESLMSPNVLMPYASEAMACLAQVPSCVAAAHKAAGKALQLLAGGHFASTECMASKCTRSTCVLHSDSPWQHGLSKGKSVNPQFHLHNPVPGRVATLSIHLVSQVHYVANDAIEGVAVRGIESLGFQSTPFIIYPAKPITTELSHVHPPTHASSRGETWLEEHPTATVTDDHQTDRGNVPHTDDHQTDRGNVPHTKNVSGACRRSLNLLHRDTVAVLGSVRAFVETQHRLSLQMILNRDVDGSMMEADPAGVIGRTLLLAASHCAGCMNDDHHSYLLQQQSAVLNFVEEVSLAKAVSLVFVAQQYGMLCSDRCCSTSFSVGAQVLEAIIECAKTHLDDVLQRAINTGGDAAAWGSVRKAAGVALAIFAFIPHNWNSAQAARHATCYLTAVVFFKVASLFCPVTTRASSAHVTVCDRLKPLIALARHGAAQWLPHMAESDQGAVFLGVLRHLDATIQPGHAATRGGLAALVMASKWERMVSCLAMYRGSVKLHDGREVNYLIDAYNGEVFANGAPLTGLPATITSTKLYKHLMGGRNFLATVVNGCWYRASANIADIIYGGSDNALSSFGPTIQSRVVSLEFSLSGDVVMEEVVQYEGATSVGTPIRLVLHASAAVEMIRGRQLYAWRTEERPNNDERFVVYRLLEQEGVWLESKLAAHSAFVGQTQTSLCAASAPSHPFPAQPRTDYKIFCVPLMHQSAPLDQLMDTQLLKACTRVATKPESVANLFARLEPMPKDVSVLSECGAVAQMVVCLETFPTQFDIANAEFTWRDDRDYKVADDQAVSWLPCCKQYLKLQLKPSVNPALLKPTVVTLLPLGPIDEKGRISGVTGKFIRVHVHEHFKYIECDSLAGRMLLACVLTFGNSGVVGPASSIEPVSHTEHIMALLRRSFSNHPWGELEVSLMEALRAHNKNPSVHLLCAALERASNETSFLYGNEHEPLEIFSKKEAVSNAYSTYVSLSKRGLLQECCVLEHEVLSLACNERLPPPRPLQSFIGDVTNHAGEWVLHTNAFPSDIVVSHCETLIVTLFDELSRGLRDDVHTDDQNLSWIPSPELLGNTAGGLSAKMIRALTQSWEQSNTPAQFLCRDFLATTLDQPLSELKHLAELLRQHVHNFHETLVVVKVASRGTSHHPQSDDIVRLLRVSHRVQPLHEHHVANIVTAADFPTHLLSFLHPDTLQGLRKLCTLYTHLCCTKDSIVRIQSYLRMLIDHQGFEKEMDIEIRREVTSPRHEIAKIPSWLVFEAEQRIRIRKVQYDTWELLMKQPTAAPQHVVTQLNMGEGKTRVIIPMMILSEIANNRVACVHALPSVIDEYSDAFTKALSTPGLRMHQVRVPFDRDVDVTSSSNCCHIRRATTSFQRQFCLIARECAASLSVKHQELQFSHKHQLPSLTNLRGAEDVLHIFDEVDELLRFSYSLVYATGKQEPLTALRDRGEIIQHLLGIVARRLAEDPSWGQFVWIKRDPSSASSGNFPNAYAPRLEEVTACDILDDFLRCPPISCAWMKSLTEQRSELVNVITARAPADWRRLTSVDERRQQLGLLRGLFGHHVLAFILSRRPQEHYGVPPPARATRLAVPYEAADVPSLRSEFAQPDVCIGLTFLAYFHRGITKDDFRTALVTLAAMPAALRIREVRHWEAVVPPEFPKDGDVDLSTTDKLFPILHRTIPVIGFWVRFCVLRDECKHFPTMLLGSAWDIANVPRAVGFSGTSDAQWLLPERIRFQDHPSNAISGATGAMVRLVLAHTRGDVELLIRGAHQSRSEAVVEDALTKGCSVVIDVGGLLAGTDLRTLAKYASSKLPDNLKAVCFFYQSKWVVMDKATHGESALKFSSIAAHQCLVLFDQARCRGVDLKLASDACALLTLGEDTSKDAFMQAVGRLRKFGRSQTIRIVAQPDVVKEIGDDLTVNGVLRWLVTNTCRSLTKGLPTYVSAAAHFQRKQVNVSGAAPPVEVPHSSAPTSLYEEVATMKPLSQLVAAEGLLDAPAGAWAVELGGTHEYETHSSKDQIAEREILREQDQVKQIEVEVHDVAPLKETYNANLVKGVVLREAQALKDACLFLREATPAAYFAPGAFHIQPCLHVTHNFFPITSDANAKPLRRVSSLVVLLNQSDGTSVAIWVTEFEAATLLAAARASSPPSLYCRHLPPGSQGGLTILCNVPCDAPSFTFPSDIVQALVFTMLFNGQSVFERDAEKSSWVPRNASKDDSVSLYNVMKSLLHYQQQADFSNTCAQFLFKRGLYAEYFHASELESAIEEVKF